MADVGVERRRAAARAVARDSAVAEWPDLGRLAGGTLRGARTSVAVGGPGADGGGVRWERADAYAIDRDRKWIRQIATSTAPTLIPPHCMRCVKSDRPSRSKMVKLVRRKPASATARQFGDSSGQRSTRHAYAGSAITSV